MPIYNVLESFRGIFNLFVDCMSNITYSNYISIGFILSLPLDCALLGIEARLIEIQIFAHSYALRRNKQLQQG